MKKIGFLFTLIGIALLSFGIYTCYDLGYFDNNKESNKEEASKEDSKDLSDFVSIKSRNFDKPSITTFYFNEKLKCNFVTEFEDICNHYGFLKDDDLSPSVRIYTSKTGKNLEDYTEIFNNEIHEEGTVSSSVPNCQSNMICVRQDITRYYQDQVGKLEGKHTILKIAISNDDGYFTRVDVYLTNRVGDKNDYIVDEFIDYFVKSIKIEDYIEPEKQYKDDNLDISLVTSKTNTSNKLHLYLNKNLYSYPTSLYSNTYNTASVLFNSKTITIKYLYNDNSHPEEDLITSFIYGDSDVKIVSFPESRSTKEIDGKKIYYNTNDNRFFLYVINNNYAYYIESLTGLDDNVLKDLLNIEIEK